LSRFFLGPSLTSVTEQAAELALHHHHGRREAARNLFRARGRGGAG
jgi:hypothetical protein